jgi:DNA-binding SARP family transcriptional activator
MLRIRVLGKLELELDGEQLTTPRGRRLRTLLGWLVLHPGLRDRGEVAGSLWPDVLDESARASLRGALALLRRELGPRASGHLVATRAQVGLAADTWIDAHEFERLASDGHPREALALVRGELLEGLADDWVYAARDRQRDRVLELMAGLAREAEAQGDISGAIAYVREAVALDPLTEASHRELIRLLACSGDRTAALGAYERARERLARELGMAPSAETRRLVEEIRTGSRGAPVLLLPAALDRAHRSPLVGRGAALERLRSSWELAQSRPSRVVLLGGEAGIGKTRLLGEFAARLHADGAAVLYGRALEESIAPYQPFAEALRPHVASLERAELEAETGPLGGELARLLPDQASRLPAPSDRSDRDPEGARYRLFEAIGSLLTSLARSTPLLLVLDDIHWADRPTLLLLGHVVRAAPGRTLVLCAYREGELGPGHPLLVAVDELRRDAGVERISLGGLVPDQVSELVQAWLGATPPVVTNALCEESGGNPFFIEELLRHIADAGGLADTNGQRSPVAALGLPEGVKDVVRARLARLGTAAEPLRTAAVAGREFALSVVARATGAEPESLIESLDAALLAQLIRETGVPGSFVFNHALVREAIYDELSGARRALLHARIGEAIEIEASGRADSHLVELANHFLLAGPAATGKAIDYARRAGKQALSQLAYENAAGMYERALEASTDVPPRARAELLLELGEVLLRFGDVAGSRERFDAAAATGRELGDRGLLARAALGRSGLSVTVLGVDPVNVALLEEALSLLGGGDEALRAQLLARLAIEVYYEPPAARREELSANALELARAAATTDSLGDALSARHVAMWSVPHLRERLELTDEMIALAERAGDRERELQGRNWRYMDLLESGDVAAARSELVRHSTLADQLRLPGYQWWAPMWTATLALLEGRLTEAEALRAQALEIGRRAGDKVAELFAWIQDFYVVWERAADEPDTPPEVVAVQAVQSALRSDMPLLLVEAGHHDAAAAQLRDIAADRFASVPLDLNWLASIAGLAHAASLLRDRARAQTLYELLLPYRSRAILVGRAAVCLGPAEMYLGMLAGAVRDTELATAHLDAAAAWCEAAGAELWLAWTEVHRARALLEASDPQRARVPAATALSRAQRLGLGRVAKHAHAVLDAIP